MSGGGRSQTSTSLVGTLLGRYRLERLLGEGGMGVVYAARHEDLGKSAAVKVLNERHDTSDEVRVRFLREGQSASRIRHPNIVDVYDVGTSDGRAYLVMELLHGEDMRGLLDRERPLSTVRTADLLLPVVSALAAAHDIGVVHRDLKPDNVFLSMERNTLAPKVLDFGISKMIDHEKAASLTGTGALLGTPYYMSPEQARANKNIDARSDQYSIGVILYECVTGRRPVEEPSIYQLIQRVVHGDFAPPRQLSPSLPVAFEQAIMTAMACNPEARFSSTRALGRALLPFASERVRANYADDFAHEGAAPEPVARPAGPLSPELRTTLRESVHERESQAKRSPRRAVVLSIAGAFMLSIALVAVMARPGSKSASPAPKAAAAPRVVPAGVSVLPAADTLPLAKPAPEIDSRKTIVSEPPGASVWIAGKNVGVTPFSLSVPADAPLDVELGLTGFETQKRVISATDSAEISFKLARKPKGPKQRSGERGARGAIRPELAPR